jgi:hypothetical protein
MDRENIIGANGNAWPGGFAAHWVDDRDGAGRSGNGSAG